MKLLLFFIFFNISSALLYSSNVIGNYQDNLLVTSKQLELIVSEAELGISDVDEEYILRVEKYLKFAKNNKKWESAIILENALANFNLYYKMDYEKTFNSLKSFEKNLSKVNNVKEIAKYYIAYAEAATFLQEYIVSMEILDKAIFNLESNKNLILEEYAYIFLKAGENSSKINNLIKSVTYFKEASELFLKQKDTISFLWSQNGLSRLLGNNGLYDEADNARKPIFMKKFKKGEVDVVIMAHITAAIEATMQNNKKKELYHVRKSLLFKDKMSSKSKQIIEILMRACATYVYARHNLLQESDENLKELNLLMVSLEQSPFLNTYYTLARSQNAFAHKNYDKTKKYILEVLESVKKTKEPENILDFEHLLAQAYQKTGNTSKALHYYKNYINLKDSIQKSTSRKRFAYVQNEFEVKKKDLEISRQKNHISLLAAENKLKSQWILIIGISLLSFFLLIYLLRARTFQKRKQKLQQQFYEDLLSSIENERKNIASDLHDSVGHNLLLIKNKFLINNKNEDVSIVNNTIKDIREISQSLHPYRFEKIGLLPSLKSVVKILQENTTIYFSEQIEQIENIESIIPKEKHLHIFRIIQEAFNNVIKHSKAKACVLKVYTEAKFINFIVKDNGIGFFLSKEMGFYDSLGMKTMKKRTMVIGGFINIKSNEKEGITVHLKVPRK